jgi:peptide/nickel transport system substrate-binding protein
MARMSAVVVIGAVAAMGLSACGGDDGGAKGKAGEVRDSIVMDLRNDIDTFDPAISSSDQGSMQLFEALYDTPVRQDHETGGVSPAMASEWEVTPTKIVFTLRPDLKCSDGTDLLPSDVADNMKRLADPKSGSPFTGRLFGPGGAKSIVGDDDADTLTIEVNQPHTDMLESMTNAFVVCPKGLADVEGLGTAPQGSGPYKIASMKRGDQYVLESWDSPSITDEEEVPAKITMRVVTSDSTRANLFETGATDIAAILGRDNERLVRDNEPIQGKAFGADAMSFNEREGRPFADERLRRAVAHVVDPEGFTKAASFGLGEPTRTFITPNMNCYTQENEKFTPEFDVDQAKAELEAAGYGPGGKELTIQMLGYDVQNSGPEYIADAVRQLGIEVEITSGTQAVAAGTIYGDNEDWDLIVYPYQTAIRTPFPMATKMSSVYGEGGALNWGRVKNAKFESLVKDKLSSVEGDERCQLWAEAEAALLERADFVPLMIPVANYFTDGLTFKAGYRVVNLRSIRNAG